MDFVSGLNISQSGAVCVRHGGVIMKSLLYVGVHVEESPLSCKYLLISICVKSQ